MIKFALAALVALAVFAPGARAADEVKPPRQNVAEVVQTCRMPAAEVDPKAPPAPRLTKYELEALKKLPLCSTEEPQETCVMVDQAAYDKALANPSPSGAAPPTWMMQYDLCMLRQRGGQSGAGPTGGPKGEPQP
jgi:hypothetical protein